MTALHRAQARTMVNGASCPGRPESPSLTEPTENSALPLPCLSSCPYPHTAQGVFHPRTPELSPWPQPLVVAAVTLPHEALLWEEMCGARLSSQGPASRDAKSKVPAHGGQMGLVVRPAGVTPPFHLSVQETVGESSVCTGPTLKALRTKWGSPFLCPLPLLVSFAKTAALVLPMKRIIYEQHNPVLRTTVKGQDCLHRI